jgi:small GTP-binding protein
MEWPKRPTGKEEPKPPPKPELTPTTTSLSSQYAPLPDLPNYDPEPADGVRVGESPVPSLTLRRILRGHTDAIRDITWSPDGKILASGAKDETIRLWDVANGRLLRTLEGHSGEVNSVSWSPDGKILASGAKDKTIRLWDVANGRLLRTLEGHRGEVNSVSWSPDGKILASGAKDKTIRLWDVANGRLLRTLEGHRGEVHSVLWSPDGKILASGADDEAIRLWDVANGRLLRTLEGHRGEVYSVSWSPDGKILASASSDFTIGLWDADNGKRLKILESHTGQVGAILFSTDGTMLVSSSSEGSTKLWRTDTGESLVTLRMSSHRHLPAFHPTEPMLAVPDESQVVIHLLQLNYEFLLDSVSRIGSVRYTTAKLVLVGDSGVGKTGLGWRLAHGEFKEHASTHGQQFWVIDDLCTTRADGTECEAVLWDLAGQAIYRHGHPLFLENVDFSLLLFDPTKGVESLNGVEFWINQLSGKDKLPPSILVGARVDVGDSILTQDELAQFCQRYGISGGYVRTSAKENIGLDQLLAVLRSNIPWEGMTTTVTTVTFKRIKDYVLSLKEQPDRANVLVSPAELREQLEAAWQAEASPFDAPSTSSGQGVQDDGERADWQFTDAEMMTAVGHLENHGYVAILRTSAGAQTILLSPDLLVNLVSSIVLQASRHPRSLGSLNETALLTGGYPFAELEALSRAEQETLSDAAILRFLEHNICFRETLGAETLLIFPGLIRQKRPLYDDVETADDVSYVVRGAVENVYPALVVLLGYTQTFTRVNQWQNQAQYEMGAGEICGFRQIEERAGEIELILYYAATTPAYVRTMFQGLFEKFLYQLDVEVTRYPPLHCANKHLQERATVIKQLRQGKDFIYCPECGEKVTLPGVEEPLALGERDRQTVARAENLAQLRRTYEMHLSRVKGFRRDRVAPRCYVSHLPAQASWVASLVADLRDAGIHVVDEAAQIEANDFILLAAMPAYKRAWQSLDKAIASDIALVQPRLKQTKRQRPNVIPLLLEGDLETSRPRELHGVQSGDFRDETRRAIELYDLVLTLYAIPFNHPAFAPLRDDLRQQWQRTLEEVALNAQDDASPGGEIGVTEQNLEEDHDMPEHYVDFDLHIAPDGRATANSPEGQATADISTQVPNAIRLSLNLIENCQTNAELLKQVGQAFYDWLFPDDIHTHFHQTEAVARAKGAKVRLRLRIEADSIASLPLEFTYRAIGGYFLAINPDTVLSRYLNLPMPPGYVRRRESPLHMLVIIADPTDQTRLPPDEWETIIQEALAEPLAAGQMTLQTVKWATRKEIRDALLKQKPDIIQFVGHGIYKDGKGYLALVDEKTKKTWLVDDERFANLYLGHDDHLGLISLATCESAKSDAIRKAFWVSRPNWFSAVCRPYSRCSTRSMSKQPRCFWRTFTPLSRLVNPLTGPPSQRETLSHWNTASTIVSSLPRFFTCGPKMGLYSDRGTVKEVCRHKAPPNKSFNTDSNSRAFLR